KAAEARIAELEGGAREAEQRAGVLAREVRTLETDLARLAKSQEAQSTLVLQRLHARTSDQNQAQGLERGLVLVHERSQRAEARSEELETQLAGGGAEERERVRELAELATVLERLEKERSAALGEAEGLETQRNDLEARRNALEVEI